MEKSVNSRSPVANRQQNLFSNGLLNTQPSYLNLGGVHGDSPNKNPVSEKEAENRLIRDSLKFARKGSPSDILNTLPSLQNKSPQK